MVWKGWPAWGGYGEISIDNRKLKAHRVAWMVQHGKTLERRDVLQHTCGNRLCINPDHLTLKWIGDGEGIPKTEGERLVTIDKLPTETILAIRAAWN